MKRAINQDKPTCLQGRSDGNDEGKLSGAKAVNEYTFTQQYHNKEDELN